MLLIAAAILIEAVVLIASWLIGANGAKGSNEMQGQALRVLFCGSSLAALVLAANWLGLEWIAVGLLLLSLVAGWIFPMKQEGSA